MKIPVYEQQLVPTGNLGVTQIPADQMGNNMQKVGEGMQNLAAALIKRQRAKDKMWYVEATSKADFDMQEIMLSEKMPEGGEGFSKSLDEKLNKYSEDTITNAPDSVKEETRIAIKRIRDSIGLKAYEKELVESYRFMGERFDNATDLSAKAVNADAGKFEYEMGKLSSSVNELNLPPDKMAAMRELARGKLAWNSATGRIDQGQGIDAVKASPEWKVMTIEEQDKALKYADQKQREFKAQKSANLAIEVSKTVVSNAPIQPGGMVDLDKAKSRAVEMYKAKNPNADPEDILAVETRTEQEVADKEREYKRDSEARSAFMMIELDKTNGNYTKLIKDYPWLKNQPEEFQRDLNEYAGKVSRGETVKTDWHRYDRLMKNPSLIMATNLDALKHVINKNELDQLRKIKEELSKPGAEQNITDTGQIITNLLNEAGHKDKVDQGKFRSLLQSRMDEWRAANNNKKMTQPEIENMAKDLLFKEKTAWYQRDKPSAFDLINDASEEELLQIDEMLIKRNMQPTDANRARMLMLLQDSE